MRNVSFPRVQAICLSILALLQMVSGVVLISWALPLFVDPPLLGNGIGSASYELTNLISKYPHEFERLGSERVNKNPTLGVFFLCNNFRQIDIHRGGHAAQ